MKYVDRMRLEAKSLLCFGVTSRYKTMMRKGRAEFFQDGTFKCTHLISVAEIEDTMDYILAERKKNQDVIIKEMEKEENERLSKNTENTDVGKVIETEVTSS